MKITTAIVFIISIIASVLSEAVAVGLTAVFIVALFLIFGKEY